MMSVRKGRRKFTLFLTLVALTLILLFIASSSSNHRNQHNHIHHQKIRSSKIGGGQVMISRNVPMQQLRPWSNNFFSYRRRKAKHPITESDWLSSIAPEKVIKVPNLLILDSSGSSYFQEGPQKVRILPHTSLRKGKSGWLLLFIKSTANLAENENIFLSQNVNFYDRELGRVLFDLRSNASQPEEDAHLNPFHPSYSKKLHLERGKVALKEAYQNYSSILVPENATEAAVSFVAEFNAHSTRWAQKSSGYFAHPLAYRRIFKSFALHHKQSNAIPEILILLDHPLVRFKRELANYWMRIPKPADKEKNLKKSTHLRSDPNVQKMLLKLMEGLRGQYRHLESCLSLDQNLVHCEVADQIAPDDLEKTINGVDTFSIARSLYSHWLELWLMPSTRAVQGIPNLSVNPSYLAWEKNYKRNHIKISFMPASNDIKIVTSNVTNYTLSMVYNSTTSSNASWKLYQNRDDIKRAEKRFKAQLESLQSAMALQLRVKFLWLLTQIESMLEKDIERTIRILKESRVNEFRSVIEYISNIWKK